MPWVVEDPAVFNLNLTYKRVKNFLIEWLFKKEAYKTHHYDCLSGNYGGKKQKKVQEDGKKECSIESEIFLQISFRTAMLLDYKLKWS